MNATEGCSAGIPGAAAAHSSGCNVHADELRQERVAFMDDMEVVNERLLSHHVLGTVLP